MDWLRIALLVVAAAAALALWRWGRGQRRMRQASRRRVSPAAPRRRSPAPDHLDRAERLAAREAAQAPLVDEPEHPLEALLSDVEGRPAREPGRRRRRGAKAATAGDEAVDERQMALPLAAEEPPPAPAADTPPAPPKSAVERIIVLYVRARDGEPWPGEAVREALEGVGLEFGPMRVFHHYGVGHLRAAEPLFSVANMFEPGEFDPDAPESFATRGLAIFLRLPCAVDSLMAFELMLNTAQRLAERLDGELLDDDREPLSAAAIGGLRELVLETVTDAT